MTMMIETYEGDEIEVPEYVSEKTKNIVAETLPLIKNPDDVDKILYAIDQMLSQKKMIKEMTEEKDTEKVIDNFTETTFNKAYEIGKQVEKERYTEVKKALENTTDYKKASDENLSENKEKYSYMELSRIVYEAGIILGIYNSIYSEKKIKKERDFNNMAYR